MNEIELFLYLLPILLVSLTVHELAHAIVATRLGDPTPAEEGRLTLNPIAHLDPLGTAMFAITYFLSSFVFGWAKPVSVRPENFRRPKQEMALVAVAGPVSNLVLSLAIVAVLVHVSVGQSAVAVLSLAYQVNLVLAIFNLLPVPPLDGSRIVGAAMSDRAYERWSAADQYGMFALFGVIVFFREAFAQLFLAALETSAEVMVTIVGG